jgi:hypothetical protein
MSSGVYTCGGCGAHLSVAQMRGTDCPYCRLAFPHHARAVEHAALVQQVMAQNIAAVSPWMAAPPAAAHQLEAVVHQIHQAHETARRTTNKIALAIAVTVAASVFGTILCAVLFG